MQLDSLSEAKPFDGEIRRLMIFRRAFSPDELYELGGRPKPPKAAPVIRRGWKYKIKKLIKNFYRAILKAVV